VIRILVWFESVRQLKPTSTFPRFHSCTLCSSDDIKCSSGHYAELGIGLFSVARDNAEHERRLFQNGMNHLFFISSLGIIRGSCIELHYARGDSPIQARHRCKLRCRNQLLPTGEGRNRKSMGQSEFGRRRENPALPGDLLTTTTSKRFLHTPYHAVSV